MKKIDITFIIRFETPIDIEPRPEYGDKLHFIGCATDLQKRLNEHYWGKGSRETKWAYEHGIDMLAVHLIVGDKRTELANGGFKKYCPCVYCKETCNPQGGENAR